ncbi:hypothetical protein AZH43_05955 [Acinetobacter pragensis]|uniref:Uncharacterized protein n=1 Tax=Acinetobacter pragensis TaxID=1806892 RepID=A0A151Y5W5_9GAMM|nr:hypothetical protein AZH43_05955 [Acinetobacter pragensis]
MILEFRLPIISFKEMETSLYNNDKYPRFSSQISPKIWEFFYLRSGKDWPLSSLKQTAQPFHKGRIRMLSVRQKPFQTKPKLQHKAIKKPLNQELLTASNISA